MLIIIIIIIITLITHADDSRGSKAFIRVCVSVCACVCVCVCVCVCPHDRTKTAETTITKLAIGIVHHEYYPAYPFNIRSKVKATGSQSAKNIEGDRVAGVSWHSYQVSIL